MASHAATASAAAAERIDVLVLGSGITGLAAARALRRAGRTVELLDPDAHPGGTLTTVTRSGYTVELGPNTVQDSPALRALAEDAGCAADLRPAAPAAKRRFVVHGGRLVALPGSPPAALTTPLLTALGKLRLLSEPLRRRGPGPEESIAAFFTRRLGRQTAALADAMVLGVYAGDPLELAVGYAFRRVHALEQEHGSLLAGLRRAKGPRPPLLAFAGGFSVFAEKLAAGLTIRPGRALAVRREDGRYHVTIEAAGGTTAEIAAQHLVTALPAAATAAVLAPLGTTAPIAALPHAPVTVVTLGYPRDRVGHPLDGFGFLAPHGEGRRILGCLFSSTLFPDRAPAGSVLLTAMVGGRRRAELVSLPEAELLALVQEELGDLLGTRGEPELALVRRWQPGIPQPTAAWRPADEAAATLEAAHPGLTILGSWRYGVGVPDCARAGWTVGTTP